MQKDFYYKLFKRLGIFSEATFTDNEQTITFPSGGGSATFVMNGRTGNVSAGVTNYFALDTVLGETSGNGSTVDPTLTANQQIQKATIVAACTLSQFSVTNYDAPGTGFSHVLTVYKNGSPTAVTITISDTAISGSDLTHTLNCNDGDLLAVKVIPQAGGNPFRGCWKIKCTLT
jgi:hypothetical protein